MSRSSFPRPEHAALLREQIEQHLASLNLALELTELRPDHYRCCYRFGLRALPEQQWAELSVHFQVAERMEARGTPAELHRLLEGFLARNALEPKGATG